MKKRIAIVLILIIAVVLGRGFFFYSGFYSPPPSPLPGYEDIVVTPAPSGEFTDNYTPGEGIILIDLAHGNRFDVEELNVLILRLVSRGLTIKFLGSGDDLEKELLGDKDAEEVDQEEAPVDEENAEEVDQDEAPVDEENAEEVDQDEEVSAEADEDEELEDELPGAFIIVSPRRGFSDEDGETIEAFVDNGGKLLFISDPTRFDKINDISLRFGLIFESDYLYNQKDNEINYKNIFIAEFEENEITKNLEKITLYTAGSISSANSSIAFVDENTFSSVIETRDRLSPIALTRESKVLAIYDLTFITEPYNGTLDNNQLIANVADWLIPSAEEMPPAEETEVK